MAKRKTVRKQKYASKSAVKKTASKLTQAQIANQVTWKLKGDLKNVRLAGLRIGKQLARVRDEKLYAELGHADIEEYAEKRLQLGKTSLYRYILVYEWACKSHPEWLEPKPKGAIPDLSDIADMIWIEKQLKQKDLKPAEKSVLQALNKKALDGELRQGEVDKLRRRGVKVEDNLKSFTSKLRNLRMRGSQLVSMPDEVITHIDAAINILKNAQTLAKCGITGLDVGPNIASA